jgi:predicted peroxiredoxin
MAVGLHLAENQVTVVLLDAAVWLSTRLRPDLIGADNLRRHLEMVLALGGSVVVEQESLQAQHIREDRLVGGVTVLPATAIAGLAADADAAFSF